jgi:hypothetical protein
MGDQFLQSTRFFLGTPWLYRGRSEAGLDCGGLLIAAGKRAGLVDPNYEKVYGTDDSYQGLHETLAEFADEIGPEIEPADGDIWTYSFMGDMHAHCAVHSATDGTVVHAYPVVGAVAEHSASGKWIRKIHRRYRVRVPLG